MLRVVDLQAAQLHAPRCQKRLALLCPIPIECPHGYDVCPTCDRCNCGLETPMIIRA